MTLDSEGRIDVAQPTHAKVRLGILLGISFGAVALVACALYFLASVRHVAGMPWGFVLLVLGWISLAVAVERWRMVSRPKWIRVGPRGLDVSVPSAASSLEPTVLLRRPKQATFRIGWGAFRGIRAFDDPIIGVFPNDSIEFQYFDEHGQTVVVRVSTSYFVESGAQIVWNVDNARQSLAQS